MKRPFVIVVLLYGTGLLLAEWLQPPLWILFVMGLGTAVLGAALAGARGWLLAAALVLVGWTNHVAHTAVIGPQDLRRIQNTNVAIVTLRGRLLETPAQRVQLREGKESLRAVALLEVTHRVALETGEVPAYGRVLVTTPGGLESELFGGQTVEVRGVLAQPPLREAEGLFDYREYLRRQRIYYQLKAESHEDWRLLSHLARPPLSDRFQAWAQKVLTRGLPEEDEPLRLLWAMTLGSKALPNEVYEPFIKSGTMHIFAISGLHIALICALLVALLRVLRVSRSWCGLLVVPLIWFYTGATGWQPSAIRSAVMMTVVIGGWALRRPTDLINSLAAAAFAILIWDPQQLFGASFQLSFFVVLSLALLVPPIQAWLDRLMDHDPLLPRELIPAWKRRLHTPLRWVATSAATSAGAWLGSVPLTAYYFHLFSPMTLLANMVVVPLSSLALASNLGALLCGTWLPWAGELFNHGAWFWMACMVKISEAYEFLPLAVRYVRAPGALDFAVYYSLLVGFLSGWLLVKGRRGMAYGSVACALALGAWHYAEWRTEAKLTLIPSGGAMVVYAAAPEFGGELLVDCSTTNQFRYLTKPFLQGEGVNRLSAVAMTHGDLRHIGAAELLAQTFDVRRVYASPIVGRSPAYRKAIKAFSNIPGLLHTVTEGDALKRWKVVHPASDERWPRADDGALALEATVYGTRLLLLSDLGKPGQEALMRRHPNLRADIVITGLPSNSEAVCEPLLEGCQPQLVIVADAEFPANERAPERLRERLTNRGFQVVYTRQSGAVTLTFHSGSWELRSINGVRMRSSRAETR